MGEPPLESTFAPTLRPRRLRGTPDGEIDAAQRAAPEDRVPRRPFQSRGALALCGPARRLHTRLRGAATRSHGVRRRGSGRSRDLRRGPAPLRSRARSLALRPVWQFCAQAARDGSELAARAEHGPPAVPARARRAPGAAGPPFRLEIPAAACAVAAQVKSIPGRRTRGSARLRRAPRHRCSRRLRSSAPAQVLRASRRRSAARR